MWAVRHGSWWLVQRAGDGTLSLGVHVDPRRRQADAGPYGPYIDVHLLGVVVSFGRHPGRANGLVTLLGQGGIMRPDRADRN